MKYIHYSKTFEIIGTYPTGKPMLKWNPGVTMNIGRNAKKRELRADKPRKHWRVIARNYGYAA